MIWPITGMSVAELLHEYGIECVSRQQQTRRPEILAELERRTTRTNTTKGDAWMIKRLVKMSVEDLLHNYHAACGFPNGQPMRQEIRSELERRIDSNRVQVHAPVERKPLAQMNFGELMSEFGRMDDETEIVRYQRDQVIDEIGSRRLGRNPK